MQLKLSFRLSFIIAGLFCLLLLSVGYLLEYGFHLEPCPLCLLQRYVFWAMAFVFGLGALHDCKNIGRYLYSGIAFVLASLGASLALRHIWLQHLPPEQAPACTAGLERMLQFQPWLQVLKTVLTASGQCAKVDFTILTLSLPVWTLFSFLALMIFIMLIIILQKKRRI